ncbi:MAG TPA: hypothetical protein VFS39_14450 [Nitrospira sp.]|nr:hypothetical protein [Nitrospira sp.]
MKHLILLFAGLWLILEVTAFIRFPKHGAMSPSLARLADAPPHRVIEPYRNAYFFLIGFAAGPSFEPAQVGYEIWVESRDTAAGTRFDYDKPGRFDLHVTLPLRQTVPAWEADDDPITAFRAKESSIDISSDRHRELLKRYDRCLGMPFDDWGFSLRAVPRYEDVITAHRLYIAGGFAQSLTLGMDRLYKELGFWRLVLREASTITTKVIAQVVIRDDATLLSRMLSRPSIDKAILARVMPLVVPLSIDEYSLRWPIQHQIALSTRDRSGAPAPSRPDKQPDPAETWLTAAAHLPPDAFRNIEHPTNGSHLSKLFAARQTEDLYAAYYDELIRVSGSRGDRTPRLREVDGKMGRNVVERFLTPMLQEPGWELFLSQLLETDAHLRLTALQTQLRKPSTTPSVPARLAEFGSQYFDPFTGLPMLWSPTQRKLYSVGRDRLDDGGDASFDIAVPAVVSVSHPSPLSLSPSFGMRRR